MPSWRHFGLSWVLVEPSWDHLGSSGDYLSPAWGHLGAILGPSRGHLGVILGHPGAILDHLGHPGAIPGPSWAILGHLGAILEPSGPILAPFWGAFRVPECIINRRLILLRFLMSFWDQFWDHFGIKIGPRLVSFRLCVESPDAASPRDGFSLFLRHLRDGKTIENHWFLMVLV